MEIYLFINDKRLQYIFDSKEKKGYPVFKKLETSIFT